MSVTIGKIIWVISFIIFLVVAYNLSTFQRVWDILFGQQSSITVVDKYNPFIVDSMKAESLFDSLKGVSAMDTGRTLSDMIGEFGSLGDDATVAYAGVSVSAVNEICARPSVVTENDLYLKVERLKWEMEQINESIVELEVKIAALTSESNMTTDNLVAIIGALTPLLLPIIASRFKGNSKEISLRKKQ